MDYDAIIQAALARPDRPTWINKKRKSQLFALVNFIKVEFAHWDNMHSLCRRVEEAKKQRVISIARKASAETEKQDINHDDAANEAIMLQVLKADIFAFQTDQWHRTKALDEQGVETLQQINAIKEEKEANIDRCDNMHSYAPAMALDKHLTSIAAQQDERIEELNDELSEMKEIRNVMSVIQGRLNAAMKGFATTAGLEGAELDEWVYHNIWFIEYLGKCRGNLDKAGHQATRYILDKFDKGYFRLHEQMLLRLAVSLIFGPGAEHIDFSCFYPEQIAMQISYQETLARASDSIDKANSDMDAYLLTSGDNGEDEDGDDVEEGEDQEFIEDGDDDAQFAATIVTTPPVDESQGLLIDLSDSAGTPQSVGLSDLQVLAGLDNFDNLGGTSIYVPNTSAIEAAATQDTSLGSPGDSMPSTPAAAHAILGFESLSLGGNKELQTHSGFEGAQLDVFEAVGNHLSGIPACKMGASRYCHRCRTNTHADKDCDVPDVKSDLTHKFGVLVSVSSGSFNGSCEHCGKQTHASHQCPDAYPEEERDDYCTVCKRNDHRDETCFRQHPELLVEHNRKKKGHENREARMTCSICGARGYERKHCRFRHPGRY